MRYPSISANKGFLALEALLGLALFSLCVFATASLSWGARQTFDAARDRSALFDALAPVIADSAKFDTVALKSAYGNDGMTETLASSTGPRSPISFDLLEADGFSSYGKDTCPVTLDFYKAPTPRTSAALAISSANAITDMQIKDGFAYISADSNSAADPDLFVFDIRDMAVPKLVSSLGTGPGIVSLSVAGSYVYAAQGSSANQLQVIDIHDRAYPSLVAQVKVPLDNASSTRPNGSAIYYDKGFVYLGTEKGDSPELTIWSAADPAHPQLAGRYETGTIIEKIHVQGDRAYLAGAQANQLVILDVSDPTFPKLVRSYAPSGWQTQVGQGIDVFQSSVAFGRNTGGFNSTANPEFLLYDGPSGIQKSSFDEPGGIYGIVARPPHFLLLTRRASGQLRADDASGAASAAYDIPGTPAALACDRGNIYVASNNSPSLTLIKDFHE